MLKKLKNVVDRLAKVIIIKLGYKDFFVGNNCMKNSKRLHFLLAIVSILMLSSLKSHRKYITNKNFASNSNASANCLHKLDSSSNDLLLHEVPVLCYHQLREWKKTDSKNARTYIMHPERFQKQIKMLADSGYHLGSS